MSRTEKRQDGKVLRNPEEKAECEICGITLEPLRKYGGVWVCLDCQRTIADPRAGFEAEGEEA